MLEQMREARRGPDSQRRLCWKKAEGIHSTANWKDCPQILIEILNLFRAL
jgi:hypothetical protein